MYLLCFSPLAAARGMFRWHDERKLFRIVIIIITKYDRKHAETLDQYQHFPKIWWCYAATAHIPQRWRRQGSDCKEPVCFALLVVLVETLRSHTHSFLYFSEVKFTQSCYALLHALVWLVTHSGKRPHCHLLEFNQTSSDEQIDYTTPTIN